MIFYDIDILWYHYIIAGFLVGAYLHSNYFHHAIHWSIIKILQGFVWLLVKTDPLYQKPKKVKPASIMPPHKKTDLEVGEDELKQWLSNNPDLSVESR